MGEVLDCNQTFFFEGVVSYLCASLVAIRLDTLRRMPPPLSMMANVLV